MPLTNVQIRPGLNKSDTPSGAEGQWIDSDFVRFRYGQPEKIGGFQAIGQKTIAGPARAQHCWNDLEGRKYAALGTSKALYIYYEDAFYDITPLDTAISGATFTTTNTSTTVTVNKTSHNLELGEYITFTSVTPPTGAGFVATDFENNTFEVLNVAANTFDITMPSAATGSTSATGSGVINPYVEIGPTIQTYGYGWGTGFWGGLTLNPTTDQLNEALDTSETGVDVDDGSKFSADGF